MPPGTRGGKPTRTVTRATTRPTSATRSAVAKRAAATRAANRERLREEREAVLNRHPLLDERLCPHLAGARVAEGHMGVRHCLCETGAMAGKKKFEVLDYYGRAFFKASELSEAEGAFERLEKERTRGIMLNPVGEKLAEEIEKLYPNPVLLLGDTGWGKSFLVQHIARSRGLGFSQMNAHPGMDMSILVGMWRPQPKEGHITIEWEDGELTRRVRQGGVFMFEELTRAPQEAMSRLYGLLDTSYRSWSMPECGSEVEVSEDFWMIATANPQGSGYYTQRLDRALLNRFYGVFTINEPIADEFAIAIGLVGHELAGKVLKFIDDVRHGKTVNMPTRDMVIALTNYMRGMPFQRAVEVCMNTKQPDKMAGILELARLHVR